MSDLPPGQGHVVSLREVYQLVDKVRIELLAEIKGVSSHVDAALVAHQAEHTQHITEHKQHEQEHKQDTRYRSSLWRWAVTSMLTGVGVLVALVATMTDFF